MPPPRTRSTGTSSTGRSASSWAARSWAARATCPPTYYNPGGLALAQDSGFLLSVQGFKAETLSIKPLDAGPLPSFSQTTYATFPGFVAAAFPQRWFGEKTHLAFSILTRQQHNLRVDERVAGDALPPALQALSPGRSGRFGLENLFDQRMRETWGGLTFSRRLSDSVGLGGTLFGVHRGQRTRWEQSLQLAYADGSGVSALVVDDFNYTHWRLLGKVGLAWEGGATRLGLAVTSPSAGLFGSGQGGFTRSAAGANVGVREAAGPCSSTASTRTSMRTTGPRGRSPGAAPGGAGSLQIHASAEWFAPVDRFTVLSGPGGPEPRHAHHPLPGPAQRPQRRPRRRILAGRREREPGPEVGRDGALRRVRHRLLRLSGRRPRRGRELQPGLVSHHRRHRLRGREQPLQPRRRPTPSAARSATSRSRGVPPGLPVIGEGRRVGVRSTRWVFVLGYLFGPRSLGSPASRLRGAV